MFVQCVCATFIRVQLLPMALNDVRMMFQNHIPVSFGVCTMRVTWEWNSKAHITHPNILFTVWASIIEFELFDNKWRLVPWRIVRLGTA